MSFTWTPEMNTFEKYSEREGRIEVTFYKDPEFPVGVALYSGEKVIATSSIAYAEETGSVEDESLTENEQRFLKSLAEDIEEHFELMRPDGWDR